MIFITGFHHSGTSFLADIVKQFGYEFGGPLDRHNELEEWKLIDDELIVDWQKPKFTNKSIKINIPEKIEAYKNPRMMITAPFWMSKFSHAKWLSINRKPADVAMSIMADKTRDQNPLFWYGLINHYTHAFATSIVEHAKSRYDTFHLEVPYEDLCKYPTIAVSSIGYFLGKPEKIPEVIKWVEENVKYKTYAK